MPVIETEKKCETMSSFSLEKVCRSSNWLKNLRAVVLSHPDSDARDLGMSVIHLAENKKDRMLECLQSIAEKHPESSLIQRRIGEFFLSRNDYRQAIIYFQNTLKMNKDDLTAMIWLGLTYAEIGERKKAAVVFKKLKEFVFILQASDSNWT